MMPGGGRLPDQPLHPLLARHLAACGAGEATPPDAADWPRLIEQIEARYRDADAARADADRAEVELRDARSHARAAARAEKGRAQFIANMSHELRTPLNAILGYSEMLAEELVDPKQARLLDDVRRIDRAGRTLLGLINDLLDLAKIDAGRMQLVRERFEVAPVIDEATEPLTAAVRAASNHLELDLAADLGAITTDPNRLRQCIATLVGNAIRTTRGGEIRITGRREGNSLVVEVADTGTGLTEDQQAVVFAEFESPGRPDVRSHEGKRSDGSGLGLALTRRFVELMGGAIALRSAPGQGSTFTLRVPDQEGVSAEQAARLAAESDRLSRADGRIVLVVDDDPDVHDMVGRILGKSGFRVAGATEGERGLALARRLMPCAIVLDLVLPGQSGWEILSRLKAEPDLSRIPVVVLSTLDDRRRGLALGAEEFLVKPVDRVALLAAIRRNVARPEADVLIVDDDFATRRLLRTYLEKAGLPCRTAANGQEALDAVHERSPGVIVLDLMMPVMDGLDFVKQLREQSAYDHVPIVVTTAKQLTDAEQRSLETTVERVLSKQTWSMEELLRHVTELGR